MTERIEKQIWANGRRGSVACISITEYETGSIVATAETDQITRAQLRKVLNFEYPNRTFYASIDRFYIRADADPV